MNIKQAPCMARIVAPGHPESGWIVSVLSAAPVGRFVLPDGYPAYPATDHPAWVCESLMHSDFNAATSKSGRNRRATRYAVISDLYLRPLPGIEVPQATETAAPKELGVAV